MKIRPYAREDWPAVYRLARMMHDESPVYREVSFAPEAIEEIERSILAGNLVCFVADGSEGIVGFFIGGLIPYFFSREFFAYDLALYVDPDLRGASGAALRLFVAFREWAKASGARQIRIGVSTGIAHHKYGSFMRKMGLQPCGEMYSLNLVP